MIEVGESIMKVNFALFIVLLIVASTWVGPVESIEPSLSQIVFSAYAFNSEYVTVLASTQAAKILSNI